MTQFRKVCFEECDKLEDSKDYCLLFDCIKRKVRPKEIKYYEWTCPICESYNKNKKENQDKLECSHCRMRFYIEN